MPYSLSIRKIPMHKISVALLAVGSIAALGGVTANAATHSFALSTVFDASDVPAPIDPTLVTLFDESSFAGDQVVTVASGSFDELLGVFRKTPGESSVETVLDASAISPTTGNLIVGLLFPQGDGVDLLTSAASTDNSATTITEIDRYGGSTNTLTTIVARNGQLPGETASVDSVGLNQFAMDEGLVTYRATVDVDLLNERTGLFLSPVGGGSTTTLVDTTMSVPGASEPSSFVDFRFGQSGYDSSQAVFLGEFDDAGGSGQGIFTVSSGAAPVPLFIEGNSLPSAAIGPFATLFGAPVIDNGDVLFRASDFPNAGLFGILDGTLKLIADSDTPLPQDPASTFDGFAIGSIVTAGYSIDSGRVLFEASGSDGSQGVYLYDDGDISLVLKNDDLIDGLLVAFLNINPNSLRGNQFVMDLVLVDQFAGTFGGSVVLASFGSPADFNGDGLVDDADLAQWEADYGLNSNSDADGDGDSDGADFLAWQQQVQLPGTALAVPEPATLLVLLIGLVSLVQRPYSSRF